MSYSNSIATIFYIMFLLYMSFGIYGIYIKLKNTANRIFFLICAALAIWSLGFSFGAQAQDVHTSIQWHRFAALGWGSLYSLTLHFFCGLLIKNNFSKIGGTMLCFIYLPIIISLN